MDDGASTAVMLEMVRALAYTTVLPNRAVIFRTPPLVCKLGQSLLDA